jgi:hypothetical protein
VSDEHRSWCTRPPLSESHDDHGHYCHGCGGEFPDPDNCETCALEEMRAELQRLRKHTSDLLEALREQMAKCWCMPPASRCSMCQRHAALILQIES